MKEFKSSLANIGEVFGNYQAIYKIPIIQRIYVWQEEDVKELLEDIESSFTNDSQSNYFVGGMVFSKNGGDRLIVIDGQQRLATLMLLISSAYDFFKEKKNRDQSKFLNQKLGTTFQDPNTGEVKNQYFLELHKRDDPIFQTLLKGKEVTKKNISVSENNLIIAKAVTKEFVNKMSESELQRYMAYLLSKVHVVKTIAEDQSTAFQIFETLNNRGAHLEPEDLLKNLLLQIIDDKDYDFFSEKWQQFVKNLMENGKYVVRVPTFLKHFIMSKGNYINKNDIFDWFKEQKYTRDQVLEILNELEESSKNYRSFIEGTFNEHTAAMKKLIFKQGNIVLLGSLNLSPSDISKISNILETIAFSYVITGTKTNKLEKIFCEISEKARNAEVDVGMVQEVLNDLNKISDDMKKAVMIAIEDFKYTTLGDKRKLEYILEHMAIRLDGANYSDYTIEHIMPQTKTSGSSNLNEDEYKNLVSSIGNMTLVHSSDNSSLKNKNFIEKQKIYSSQSCRFTSSLAKELQTGTNKTKFDRAIKIFNYSPIPTKWDQEEIDRRAKSMVNLAEHIWFK